MTGPISVGLRVVDSASWLDREMFVPKVAKERE